jgi:hypothetical protein
LAPARSPQLSSTLTLSRQWREARHGRAGLITRDIENAHLAFDPGQEPSIHGLLGSSITYRIATGPREGQKVFTLQTQPAEPDRPRPQVAESSGFSLHAGIAATAWQRDKLERLARYVSRPPVATDRLALTGGGHVRCALKTPYRDGTTHVVFEPEDFIARLAALVPKPRAHLTRYHGVFAPASAAPQAGIRHRYRDLPAMRRSVADHRLHRATGIHRADLGHLGRVGGAVDPGHPSRAPPERPRLI